jgi:Holliday junction resolvase
MTQYERGRQAEWELRDLLEGDRRMVTRSAGSHAIDLWSVNSEGRLCLYEVKSTSGSVYYPSRTAKEKQQLKDFVNTVKAFGGTVDGYYAVRFKGGQWRYFPVEELDGRPLRI